MGFLLNYHGEYQSPSLAGVCFETKQQYYNEHISNAQISLSTDPIIIVQLQTYTYIHVTDYARRRNNDQEEILSNFRWEMFLVDMVERYAYAIGLREIYIQPTEMNEYYGSQEEKNNRLN